MYKYWLLFQQTWQNNLAYPLSFGLWRLRQLLTTVMALMVWNVIFSQNQEVLGYNRSEMISYVLFVSILQGIILSTDLHRLASDIYTGVISQLLVKPINIFAYLINREIADKLKNVIFLILESLLLIAIFKPTLPSPSLDVILLLLLWILGGVVIHFFIEILFGTLGFWSPQSWGPKFLFFMIVDAAAGKLFPLDILPEMVQKAFFYTPFPYLAYAQTQLFLGRLAGLDIFTATLWIVIWSVLLGLLARFIWRRGIKDYAASGQ